MTDFVALTDWAWLLGVFGLGIAAYTYSYVTRQDPGSEVMIDLGDQIHDGAMAFLRKEYTVLAGFVVVVAALVAWAIGVGAAGAYIFGALSSVFAGVFGV